MTVKRWYYLFDRQYRWSVLARSLQYCRENKGLRIYGFVFMLNHIHLLVFSEDVSGFVRDFKRFTSKELHKNLEQTEPNVLRLFLDEDGHYEFWERTNMPKLVESEKFFFQKLEYIHNNPTRKQYVMKPEDWYWSSANPLCELCPDVMDGW
jgi:putative transposase